MRKNSTDRDGSSQREMSADLRHGREPSCPRIAGISLQSAAYLLLLLLLLLAKPRAAFLAISTARAGSTISAKKETHLEPAGLRLARP